MPLSFAQAELVGIVLHSALFGLYLNLFVQSLPFQLNGRTRPYNKVLLTSNILLFIFILSHWVAQIVRSQRAFINTEGQSGDPASLYYAFPADYMNVLKEALYVMQTLIGDCTMGYRVWIVYGRRYIFVLLPILTIIAFVVSSINVLIQLSHASLGEDVFASAVGHWAIAVFTTSVGTNLITSGLIGYRFWSIQRRVKGISYGYGLTAYAHIIIESAALYTIMTIIVLIGYSTKETWQFIFLDMLSPIIGISFTLISVRANRSKSLGQDVFSSHEATSTNAVRVRVDADVHVDAIGLDTVTGDGHQHTLKSSDSRDGSSSSIGRK